MKTTYSKALSWLVTLAMVLGMLPVATPAARAEGEAAEPTAKTKRTIALDLTKLSNLTDNDGSPITAESNVYTCAKEGWSWDNGNKTLTLNGVNIETGSVENANNYAVTLPAGAIIVLADDSENIITAGAASYNNGDSVESAAIYCVGDYKPSIGFYYGDFAIRGESKGTGTLTATGGAVNGSSSSYGIITDGTVTIESGTVAARGGTAEGSCAGSRGIFGKVTVNGGKLTATGGTAGSNGSIGIGGTEVTVIGGELTASGNDQAIQASIQFASGATVKAGDDANGTDPKYTGQKYVNVTCGSAEGGETGEGSETGTEPTRTIALDLDGAYSDAYESLTNNNGSQIAPENGVYKCDTEGWAWYAKAADGYAANTLVLDGVNIETDPKNDAYFNCAITLPEVEGGVTIVLADGSENTVKAGSAGELNSFAIYCHSGDVTIKGTGTLNATGGEGGSSGGISSGGTITIENGSIKADGGTATNGSCGISSGGTITIKNGSIKADGGTATNGSFGISAPSVKITGGTVTVTGSDNSHGIYTMDLTVTGGTVTASGSDCGIYTMEGLTVTGGAVTASSNTKALEGKLTTTGTVTESSSTDGSNPSSGKNYAGGETTSSLYVMVTEPYSEGGETGGTTTKTKRTIALDLRTFAENQSNDAEGWAWDNDAKTLTLDGVNIETGSVENAHNYAVALPKGSTIKLVGNNSITAGAVNAIEGIGKASAAIYCAGNITIQGAGKLDAYGGEATYSNGVRAENNVTINGGTLTANGNKATVDSHGIYANKVIISGGTVTANGDAVSNAEGTSYGINASSVTINGGTLTASGYKRAIVSTLKTDGTVKESSNTDGSDSSSSKNYASGGTTSSLYVNVTFGSTEGGEDVGGETGTALDFSKLAENTRGEGWAWYAKQTTVDSVTYAANTLVLSGLTLTTADKDDNNYAITLPAGAIIELADGSENTVTAGAATGYQKNSIAIYSAGDVTIQGSGTLNATGGTTYGTSAGIWAGEDGIGAITITGGTVNATGGKGGSFSAGLRAMKGVTIEGGSVTAVASTVDPDESELKGSCGIYVHNGSVSVTGGALIATGNGYPNFYGSINGNLVTTGIVKEAENVEGDGAAGSGKNYASTSGAVVGKSSKYVEVTFKPDAPEAVTAETITRAANSLTIQNSDSANEYAVTEASATAAPDSGWASGNGGALTVSGLTTGTAYKVWVRVKASGNLSASDATASDAIYTLPAKPAMATGAESVGENQFYVDPSTRKLTLGSALEASTSADFSGEVVTTGAILSAGSTCYIRVKAKGDVPAGEVLSYTCVAAAVSSFTLKGTRGGSVSAAGVTVTLAGTTFTKTVSASTEWQTNIPGVTARVTAVGADKTTATVTLSGVPTAPSGAAVTIAIPAAHLSSGAALVSTENAGAKAQIAIKDGTTLVRAGALDLTGASAVSYQNKYGAAQSADSGAASITASAEGWAWDGSSKTLTLDGAKLAGGVTLPDGAVIILKGASSTISNGAGAAITASGTVIVKNETSKTNGALSVTGSTNGVAGNLTVNSGAVTVTGGSGAAISGGLTTANGAVILAGADKNSAAGTEADSVNASKYVNVSFKPLLTVSGVTGQTYVPAGAAGKQITFTITPGNYTKDPAANKLTVLVKNANGAVVQTGTVTKKSDGTYTGSAALNGLDAGVYSVAVTDSTSSVDAVCSAGSLTVGKADASAVPDSLKTAGAESKISGDGVTSLTLALPALPKGALYTAASAVVKEGSSAVAGADATAAVDSAASVLTLTVPAGSQSRERTVQVSLTVTFEEDANYTKGQTYTMTYTVTQAKKTETAYTVTVNGTALESKYKEGDAVTVSAGAAASGKIFKGWTAKNVTLTDAQQASDKNMTFLMPAKNVTLTANWVTVYSVTGTVYANNGFTPVGGASVELMRGTQVTKSATSTDSGAFILSGVPAGSYNLVVTTGSGDSSQTVTQGVTVNKGSAAIGDITLPPAGVNSTLTASQNTENIKVTETVVSGLDALAQTVKDSDEGAVSTKVEVKMDVEAKEATEVLQADKKAIESKASKQADRLEFVDVKLTKTVTTGNTPATEAISDTSNLGGSEVVLEIALPYNMAGKYNIKVYRSHMSDAGEISTAAFSKLSKRPESKWTDGTYWPDTDNNLIYLYASKFSTYAVGYDNTSSGNNNNNNSSSNSSSSGSSSSVSYPPTVETAAHGAVTVSPGSPAQGDKVTVTLKPDSGYKADSVTVTGQDGKSVAVTDNGNGTYTFTQPAGKVTVRATFVKAGSAAFTDVAAGAYYFDAVAWAVEKGITNGATETAFHPNGACTRAQTVTFLWRAAGCPEPSGAANPFTDVSSSAYYYKAVLWAVEKGITNGKTATSFAPDATVTRGQSMTFLWRYEQSPAAAGGGRFTDVEGGAYYEGAVNWAVEQGVTNGSTETTFSPANPCTRAQIVTFLYRDLVK